jgi:hypothetical protein
MLMAGLGASTGIMIFYVFAKLKVGHFSRVKKIDHLIIHALYASVCRHIATGGKDMYEMVDKENIRKRHFVDGWSI